MKVFPGMSSELRRPFSKELGRVPPRLRICILPKDTRRTGMRPEWLRPRCNAAKPPRHRFGAMTRVASCRPRSEGGILSAQTNLPIGAAPPLANCLRPAYPCLASLSRPDICFLFGADDHHKRIFSRLEHSPITRYAPEEAADESVRTAGKLKGQSYSLWLI